jgi:hypothetical protein
VVAAATAGPGPAVRLASMAAVGFAAAAALGATYAAPSILFVSTADLVVRRELWPPAVPVLVAALVALALASRDPARR